MSNSFRDTETELGGHTRIKLRFSTNISELGTAVPVLERQVKQRATDNQERTDPASTAPS